MSRAIPKDYRYRAAVARPTAELATRTDKMHCRHSH